MDSRGRPLSGIILAGGKSKRMGQNKANLLLHGRSLLQWQVDKMRTLGIRDILLSGKDCPTLPGTRVIPDLLPNRGPLGGLHACLSAANNSRCLVLSVDAPLVPVSVLEQLCTAQTEGVCVLRHSGGTEPLIGVYDSSISQAILPMIANGSDRVQSLKDYVPWYFWDYSGPQEAVMNCNTPEEFFQAKKLLSLCP